MALKNKYKLILPYQTDRTSGTNVTEHIVEANSVEVTDNAVFGTDADGDVTFAFPHRLGVVLLKQD